MLTTGRNSQQWSPTPVPLRLFTRVYNLSLDGKRIAALNFAGTEAAAGKVDKVSLFFNFGDELRRIAAPAKK